MRGIEAGALFMGLAIAATASMAEPPDEVAKDKYLSSYDADRFRAADTDGDGLVSLAEAQAAHVAPEGYGGRRRFEAADADGDGLLSLEEAGAHRSREIRNRRGLADRVENDFRKGGAVSDDFHDAYDDRLYTGDRFTRTDKNGDGVLSPDEMNAEQKWYEEYRDAERRSHADRDGDGNVSLDEAKAQKDWEKDHRRSLERDARDDFFGKGRQKDEKAKVKKDRVDRPQLKKKARRIKRKS